MPVSPEIRQACERALALSRELLVLDRQVGDELDVDADPVMKDMLDLMRRLAIFHADVVELLQQELGTNRGNGIWVGR